MKLKRDIRLARTGRDLRNGNHGCAVGGSEWHLENTTYNEQKRDHERADVNKQWASADSVGSVKADGNEDDENSINSDSGNEGLRNPGLLEEVRRVDEEDWRAIPELVVEWHERNNGSTLQAKGQCQLRCMGSMHWELDTYKVATTETVQNRYAFLAIGEDLSIVDLFLDDSVLMVEVVPRDATVNVLHHLLCLVMLSF